MIKIIRDSTNFFTYNQSNGRITLIEVNLSLINKINLSLINKMGHHYHLHHHHNHHHHHTHLNCQTSKILLAYSGYLSTFSQSHRISYSSNRRSDKARLAEGKGEQCKSILHNICHIQDITPSEIVQVWFLVKTSQI